MMAFTHIAAGCLAAYGAAQVLHAQEAQSVLLVAGGIVGSMLPDIDHPASAFGRRMRPVSDLISAIFGHRGITHSLIAVVAVLLGAAIAFRYVRWHAGFSVPFLIGLAAGYLSHLAGDFFTNSGVPLLWPAKRRFVSPLRIFTGDFREYVLAFAMYGWFFLILTRQFGARP